MLAAQIQTNKNGAMFQSDFAQNIGGLNLIDSVFQIQPGQAAGGQNWNYSPTTGGITKRLGPSKINSAADAQLQALGFGLLAPSGGTSKTVIRAAGTKLQNFNTSTPSFTALTRDTATATSTAFSSTAPTALQQFSNGTSDILWASGGGTALPVGAYSTTKFTQNGTAAPTGAFTATVNAHNSGSWTAGGAYYWGIAYHKLSTGALSNVALDVTATVVNTDDTVTLTWAAVPDSTLYDQVWVYRSARSGVLGFTTGNLVAQVASSSTSFVDKGDLGNPDFLTAQNVPRAGNTTLDNSTLPTGTYNTLAIWTHRLVTTSGNTVYISDVNKSESWPLTNQIVVPSAGPITATGVISFTSPQANQLLELLVVFKEREIWVINPGGSYNYTTWALLFVDQVGCEGQNLVVQANGFLAWIDFRGVYMWDGTSKPIYCSRLIEPLFAYGGDLDKTQLSIGTGEFFRRENQIIWYLSSKTFGVQKFALKLDLRLTLPLISQMLTGRTIDGVFVQDTYALPIYAALTYIPLGGAQEQMVLGDASGFCYFASNGFGDAASGITFQYKTAPLSMGDPNTKKLFHKVIVWVQDVGNWNLELDYWTDYHTALSYETTQSLPISTEAQSAALWDIAAWDLASWDAYYPAVVPLIFNLQSGTTNTTQGSAIQLQFSNTNANQPITIHGYSVLWAPAEGLTA